jgi:CRISPR system Cascade subunit CasA
LEVTMHPSFNLWTEAWITVETTKGTRTDLSLEQTLLRATNVRAIHDPSPLVSVGIHRLLTAIVQDIIAPQERSDLRALWRSGTLPEAKIRAFGDQYAHRFDLFSEEAPFLQSADIPIEPDKKTWDAALLFQELPTGSFVTHYQHSFEGDYTLCPICATRGLITLPAFASSGGAGIKPSINGVPPIYVLPGGQTLFEQLWASLLLPRYQPDAASTSEDQVWWRREPIVAYKEIVQEVGYLHSLTFPARRIRLHPEPDQTPCTRCGRTANNWRVRTMVHRMGESRPKDAPAWFDPFAAYRLRDKKPPVPLRPLAGKALWREYASLFLPDTEKDKKERTLPPSALYQRGALASRDIGPDYDLFPVHCVGLRTDMKAKIFEWVEADFSVPTTLLHDPLGADIIRRGIDFATGCARALAGVFHSAFSREGTDHHTTVRSRMLADYWTALATPFRTFVLGAAEPDIREEAYATWVNAAVDEGKRVFATSAESIGDSAIALRHRVEGINQCNRSLHIRRKKALGATQ